MSGMVTPDRAWSLFLGDLGLPPHDIARRAGPVRVVSPVPLEPAGAAATPQQARVPDPHRRAHAVLLECLPSGEAELSRTTKRLGISGRTPQRRLGEQGVTFRQLVQATRERLARHYLTRTTVPFAEISFLLGFDKPSSFSWRSGRGRAPRPTPPVSRYRLGVQMAFDVGYSKTPLHKKLGCKPDRPVYVIGAPIGFAAYLRGEGFEVIECSDAVSVPDGAAHVHLFSTSREIVVPAMQHLSTTIDRAGQVWLSWPKKASGVAHDLPKALLHQSDAFGDLVDVKVCAVDATWSGLKYMIRRERR